MNIPRDHQTEHRRAAIRSWQEADAERAAEHRISDAEAFRRAKVPRQSALPALLVLAIVCAGAWAGILWWTR